jgi:preprotein translocase subunit SecG
MPDFVNTLVEILHVFVCAILMFVVLLQQGKGGGMGAAMGGGATAQVFGGRGAGNILTRATAICAATFMITSVTLAWHSSQGDRALKARQAAEHKAPAAAAKPKDAKPDDKGKPADKPAEGTPAAPTGAPPAPSK